jgi:hypothetical protein
MLGSTSTLRTGTRPSHVEWGLLRRARPPNGGVVLREVYDIKDLPTRFFRKGSGLQSLSAFLQNVTPTSVRCYGVFFGTSLGDAENKAWVNFFVSGDDRFGVRVGLLSRRPFSKGGRHITVRCLDMTPRARWKKLRFWALRVGRIGAFVRQLYETVLSPDGPVAKRARLRFESMAHYGSHSAYKSAD